jgi:O-methyltransferase
MNTMARAQNLQRAIHPWREILYRARDPRFVLDSALRGLMQVWDQISPLEFSALYRQVRGHTMCSNRRLRGLYRAMQYVVSHNISGDVVECGTARGGSAALMALTLRRLKSPRRIWLFDTFEGLPAPTAQDPDFEIANLFAGSCVGSLEEVLAFFKRLNIAEEAVFVKGLFQQTLPSSSVEQIAALHVDGDWYESVKTCLDALYDRVADGGMIQFDDYGYWQGARKAIDEFFKQRGITAPLERLDYSGRFLIKRQSTESVSAA